jgi:hypothetical protein
MTSNLFDDKELDLYIDTIFYKLNDKFDVNIEPKIFSEYFFIVMNYLDDRASKRGVKKNDESMLQYKKNLLELTTECVFETFPNFLLGAGQSVLFPIYEEYKIKLIQKSSKK